MDYGKVLKRSWHMVTRYRTLWIFGIILGIVTFSWEWALLSDLDDENQDPQGIVITPLAGETFYDALQRTWQKELDWAEQDIANGLQDLDLLFTRELGRRFVVDFARTVDHASDERVGQGPLRDALGERLDEILTETRRVTFDPAAGRGDDDTVAALPDIGGRAARAARVDDDLIAARYRLQGREQIGAGQVGTGDVELVFLVVVAAVADQVDVQLIAFAHRRRQRREEFEDAVAARSLAAE